MMEEQLRQLLLAVPGVPDSVDWGARPRGASLPGVVLNVISDVSGHTQEGPDGLSMARVQIDVYASTFGEAKVISRSIRSALDGHEGGAIQGAFRASERDSSEEAPSGGRTFRNSQDYRIAWSLA